MILRNRKALVKLMALEGLSQRRLAERAGWRSHSYVGRLMRGQARAVSPEAAERIAAALGVEVDDLFERARVGARTDSRTSDERAARSPAPRFPDAGGSTRSHGSERSP